ncbi:MotE family protein [Blastomonas aquatica]|uniref:Magnesium transporter MgtE intracellular domain-containing protein n=1 Tax=Blastomonas aquatica TaxID=1510276 RepID=A0ABQ1JQ42_9SPHN|nr:hypothetical protein [Blastomonas aquatica]GGB74454.1 hypothetical protein GCM10010833_32090 [Blastomonas aquatica]
MKFKHPSLLMLMTGAAAVSMLSHGVNASFAAEGERATPTTRLGTAIQSEMTERDRAAKQRARALELREQAIRASEKRLEANAQAQQQQKGTKTGPAAQSGAEAESATLDQLARIYQSMKPKQAARVFERLAIDVQVGVARKMRERATAQVLAAMTPDGAARLSMALAEETSRPRMQSQYQPQPLPRSKPEQQQRRPANPPG